MTERLAIRTDRATRWKAKNPAAVADLQPREGEDTKSSWAHDGPDGAHISSVLANAPSPPPLEVQALALYVFERHRSASNRSVVAGVSLLRSAVACSVIEDSQPHLIEALDLSHRSLAFPVDALCAETLARLFQQAPESPEFVICWQYSVAELLPLLQACLSIGCIRPPFDVTANAIAARYA